MGLVSTQILLQGTTDVMLDTVDLLSLLEASQNYMLSVAQTLGKNFLDHMQFGRNRHVGNASMQALQLCPVGSVCPSIPASSPGKGQSLTSAWIPVSWLLPNWPMQTSSVEFTGVEGPDAFGCGDRGQ